MSNMKTLMENWRRYERKVLSEVTALGQADVDVEEDAAEGGEAGEKVLDRSLGDASRVGVVSLVNFLNTPEGKDPKVRKALRSGEDDGTPGDEVINVNQEAKPAVGKLSPTQNEISLAKSIGWPLSSTKTLANVATGDPTGRGMKIVSSGNLVIDGHHRWSSVWSICPKCSILAVDIELPGSKPGNKLAVAHTAIAATIGVGSGEVPKATTGGADDNILGKDPETIAGMITRLVNQPMDSGQPLLNDEYVEAVKKMPEGAKYFGVDATTDTKQARQMIINKVAENLSNLPEPVGPPRDYMPQFDGGDTHDGQVKLANVVAQMKSGNVNYKAPF